MSTAPGSDATSDMTIMAALSRQVNVPEAHMEEILPAARLLSQATAVTPSDYEHAKAVFLRHVQTAGAAAENLSKQVGKRIPRSALPQGA